MIIRNSDLIDKYNEEIDRESAHEILQEKIKAARQEELQEEMREQKEKAGKTSGGSRRREESMLEKVLNSPTTRQIGRTMARELTRGLLGVLGVSSTTRRRKRRRRR
jgi:hypothetical protein